MCVNSALLFVVGMNLGELSQADQLFKYVLTWPTCWSQLRSETSSSFTTQDLLSSL